MTKPTTAELTADALAQIVLDADGKIANTDAVLDALVLRWGITSKRAWTAIACAARRLRNRQFAEEGTSEFILRVRLTERQRKHLQIMADQETGGDMSKLVRRRVFA